MHAHSEKKQLHMVASSAGDAGFIQNPLLRCSRKRAYFGVFGDGNRAPAVVPCPILASTRR